MEGEHWALTKGNSRYKLKQRETNLYETLEEYEKVLIRHLVDTWRLDPENFRQVVDDVEAFIDLKNKLCLPRIRKSR